MIVALLLILAATAGDRVATQQRVDELLARCNARGKVGLVAESGQDVEMQPLIRLGEASLEQERRFSCALSGMKLMTDLRFGFLGNEVDGNGSWRPVADIPDSADTAFMDFNGLPPPRRYRVEAAEMRCRFACTEAMSPIALAAN